MDGMKLKFFYDLLLTSKLGCNGGMARLQEAK